MFTNMKKTILGFCLLFLLSTLWAQEKKEVYTHITEDIVRQLQTEQYDSITYYFDSTVKASLSAEVLSQTMISTQQIYGSMKASKTPVVEDIGPRWMSRTPIQFEKSLMVLSLSFDSATGLVSGIFITPQAGLYMVPNYVQSLSFLESKYEFGKEGWKVKGVLSYPRDQQKHPVVIIVHGSGPMDMDGSTGNTKIYKDLAWGLATKGICVFRYDKRSFTHGSRLYMETYNGKSYTAQDEVVDDVLAAIRLMKDNIHVDTSRIFLVGHSQGGMLLPLVAQQYKAPLAGLILLAANARPIQDLLVEQMDYLYPDNEQRTYNEYMMVKEIKQKAAYSKKKNLDPKSPTDSLPFNVSASYWNYLNNYNQTKVFTSLTTPAYILQGERDYQVTMTDFELWKKASALRKGSTQFKSYPDLNHLFITGKGPSKPSEYQLQGNLSEEVIGDMLQWMQEKP